MADTFKMVPEAVKNVAELLATVNADVSGIMGRLTTQLAGAAPGTGDLTSAITTGDVKSIGTNVTGLEEAGKNLAGSEGAIGALAESLAKFNEVVQEQDQAPDLSRSP